MAVPIEKTSSLGRLLTIEVPAKEIQVEEKNIVKHLQKNMRVDGFRIGKVPESYIQKKHGKETNQEAVSKVLEKTLSSVLKENNLRPANTPHIELKDTKDDSLTYTVSFEVFPEIDIKDFASIILEKEVADITAADLDSGVTKLQDQFAVWADITDRAAKQGDKLTIDFVGLLDGAPFENGSAENFDLELGSKRFIAGFEEGLIGVTVNSAKTLDITFPADYGASNLAGKAVQFEVTVKNIQGKVPAALDADFAARIGIEDKDVSKVRDKVRENMLKYADDIVKTKLREQALDQLYVVNPFDLPESLLAHEKHNMIHEKLNKDANDHNHDLTPEQDIEITAAAKKRVAIGLLLNEIIQKHNIKPEEERILAKIRSMSLMYGGNAELIRKMYYESKELRDNVQNMVLTDQAADLIVANATIKEKQATFFGIVNAPTEQE